MRNSGNKGLDHDSFVYSSMYGVLPVCPTLRNPRNADKEKLTSAYRSTTAEPRHQGYREPPNPTACISSLSDPSDENESVYFASQASSFH